MSFIQRLCNSLGYYKHDYYEQYLLRKYLNGLSILCGYDPFMQSVKNCGWCSNKVWLFREYVICFHCRLMEKIERTKCLKYTCKECSKYQWVELCFSRIMKISKIKYPRICLRCSKREKGGKKRVETREIVFSCIQGVINCRQNSDFMKDNSKVVTYIYKLKDELIIKIGLLNRIDHVYNKSKQEELYGERIKRKITSGEIVIKAQN